MVAPTQVSLVAVTATSEPATPRVEPSVLALLAQTTRGVQAMRRLATVHSA